MKLYLQNTIHGLVPMTDDDYSEKMKLKLGQIYSAEIRMPRNYKFLQKYFALINCAWAFLTEKQTAFFGENKHSFRKTVEVAAGNSEKVFLIDRREWADVPKSISFSSMDENEFGDLYGRVLDVLLRTYLKDIPKEEFEKQIINFL